jgi:hypothetical protein
MQAGSAPLVIVRAGLDVKIDGWDRDRVFAATTHKYGLKLERRSGSALGHVRARAKIGDFILFDISGDLLKRAGDDETAEAIHAEAGGDAVVLVPYDSTLKVYAGRNVQLSDVHGSVTVYASRDVHLQNCGAVGPVSAGGALDVDCQALAGDRLKLTAGRDLRFYVHDLDNTRIVVDDLGGSWEGVIGDGSGRVYLNAGGDVTLVTDRPVVGLSPDEMLGRVESPAAGADASI